MILFKEDWAKYPLAKPDYTTKNTTWLRHAHVLKGLGLDNHLFHLALHDPSLLGIDSHRNDLDGVTQSRILQECKVNPWYFFREVARVPAIAGKESSHFRANRANIALYWCFFNNLAMMLVMLRQQGKSISVDMLTILIMNVMGRKTTINGSTKDDALRAVNIRRLRELASCLPEWMQLNSPSDSKNLETYTVNALGNYIRYVLPQRSKKAAELAGRGSTAEIYFGDEIAYQYNISVSLPAALLAGLAARDIAASVGAPHGTLLTTTAGSRDDPDGAYCYRLMSESTSYTEKLLDCKDRKELERIVKGANSNSNYRVAATFYAKALGISDEWIAKAERESMVKGDQSLRDIHSIWTSGSQLSVTPGDILKAIKKSEIPPKYMEITQPDKNVIQWYISEPEIEQLTKQTFIITLDTSDAVGKDDIAMVMESIHTGEIYAIGTYNRVNIISFSKWVFDLLLRFPKALCIIERRSTGTSVIDYLILKFVAVGINPFRRLYNTIVQNKGQNPELYQKLLDFDRNMMSSDLHIRHKNTIGFSTSGSGETSRTGLYSDTFLTYLTIAKSVIRSTPLILQIAGLVVKNGRVDHGDGGKDDLVIAMLLGGFVLTKGKNLSFYGIDSADILDRVDITNGRTELTAVDREQIELRDKLQTLTRRYRDTKDVAVAAMIKQQMVAIDNRLILRQGDTYSLESVIMQIDDEKMKSSRAHHYLNTTQQSLYQFTRM